MQNRIAGKWVPTRWQEPSAPKELPKPIAELKAWKSRIANERDPLRKAIADSKAVRAPLEEAFLAFVLAEAHKRGITKLSINAQEFVTIDFDYVKNPFLLWDFVTELGIASTISANIVQAGVLGYVYITDGLIGHWDTATGEYLGEPNSFWF